MDSEAVETVFRQRLRQAREGRGLTQKQLADLLCERGVQVRADTIAKTERGERKATLDEVSAIADVFEVSVDTLLGHARAKQTKDREFLVSALTEAAIDLTLQARSLSETLKDALADLDGFELQGSERGLVDSCSAGVIALDSAVAVIGDAAFAFDSVRYRGQPLVFTGRTDTGEIIQIELKEDEEK